MAREYSSKKPRRGSGIPQQMLAMVVTFILGYFTASIFDIDALSHWLSSQVMDTHQPQQRAVKEQAKKERVPTKPKFEFYTLLANEKGVGGQPTVVAVNQRAPTANTVAINAAAASGARQVNSSATTATATTAMTRGLVNNKTTQPQVIVAKAVNPQPAMPMPARGAFVVQVASFKARQDAEHMKGLLILKGFEVAVVPISTPNQGNWFRVVIGPYPNRGLAQQAQGILARTQHLRGMVRSA